MQRTEIYKLQDIPNIGKAIEKNLILLGLNEPIKLIGKDPYQMYSDLCKITGTRHDPCLIDVFISAVRYMEGGPPRKWWEFTNERKKKMDAK
ncbi:MAG: helix-hairpin-helix domain-containing protein [Thiohalophilus sp.]|jgi:hypothetical protein